tara:strand:- start:962 stop:1891 length:930 start_codon:yes stop_codon:yes gene_type:complete
MINIALITPVEDKICHELQQLGEVYYAPRCNKEAFKCLLENEIEIIFTNPNQQMFTINKEILEASNVKIICTASTGLNHIDIEYCKKNNIKIISITRDFQTIERITSTAEHAFALMMALLRNIPRAFDSVKKGKWSWEPFVGRQLDHLTIGVIGYGRLGRMMTKYCASFGSRILICDPHIRRPTSTSLQELFDKSDVVSLHVHVTDETRHMVNEKLLDGLETPVYLINTSRGEIVDEKAIIKALETGKLLGYATDVLEDEFGNIENSVLTKRQDLNIIVTPHIAGMTKEARDIAYSATVEKLKKELMND